MSNAHVFRRSSPEFLDALAKATMPRLCMADEPVVVEGDLGAAEKTSRWRDGVTGVLVAWACVGVSWLCTCGRLPLWLAVTVLFG